MPVTSISSDSIDQSTFFERMPHIFQERSPEVASDGANYFYNTSFGIYSIIQPLNIIAYDFPNGSELIRQSSFILQENQSGTWLNLIDYSKKVFNVTNETFLLSYNLTKRLKGILYDIGNVSLKIDFFLDLPPKISLKLKKYDAWFTLGLNHSRWIWNIIPSWLKYVNDEEKNLIDASTDEFNKETAKIWLTNEETYSKMKYFLRVDVEGIRMLCKVHGGNEPFFNSRGIVFTFPIDRDYIDPVTVIDQNSAQATRFEGQRKVFKNPRGLGYFYALTYYDDGDGGTNNDFRIYKSVDGETWLYDSVVSNSEGLESASLKFLDNDTLTLVYVVYNTLTSSYSRIWYKRGYIPDDVHSISWDSQVLILEGTVNQLGAPTDYIYDRPVMTLDSDGYLYVAYRYHGNLTASDYLYCDGNLTVGGRDDWSKSGSAPFLDVTNDGNHIYTSTKDDIQGDFTFEDAIFMGNQRFIEVYCRASDGNDQAEIYVWDSGGGGSWKYAGVVMGSLGYSWQILDVTSILTTTTEITDAKMYLKKENVGKEGTVYADCARIRIDSSGLDIGYSLRMVASNQTFNPDSNDWSGELSIVNSGLDSDSYSDMVYPTIVAFNSSASMNILVASKYRIPDKANTFTCGYEYEWDGSNFTLGRNELWRIAYSDSLISTTIDPRTNIAYCVHHNYNPTEFYASRWNLSEGWLDSSQTVGLTLIERTVSTTLDVNGSRFIVLFSSTGNYYGASPSNITLRYRTTESFGAFSTIGSFSDDNEYLNWFSASLHDDEGYIQLVYTTQTNAYVRFFEYPERPPSVCIPCLFIGMCFIALLVLLALYKKR